MYSYLPMFVLFPRQKRRAIFSLCIYLAILIAVVLLNPSVSRLFIAFLTIIGSAAILLARYMEAANQHTTLLSRLYNQLDAEGFLHDYEPFLSIHLHSQYFELMIRLHVSNAYCALGRFDDAIQLLSSIEYREDKHERLLLGKFSVLSNLCYCYEQKGDVKSSKSYLEQLRACKTELEEIQEQKPENKRMVFNITLNEQCMRFLEEGTMDIDTLKTQVQAKNTQQLHRVTTSLWIARAYLARNERREAENLLKRIVTMAGDLYPGQAAKRLLDDLPERDTPSEDT